MFSYRISFFPLMVLIFIMISACNDARNQKKKNPSGVGNDIPIEDSLALLESKTTSIKPEESDTAFSVINELSPTELRMIEQGLVNIKEMDPDIVVDMKYASPDNFLGKDIYDGMARAYLQPDVAEMLLKAQKFLKQIEPGYSLVVYDAARPRSAQQKMWDAVKAPFDEKIKFLSNPANGSIHNFGAAVDAGIVDKNGIELDMGTGFDHMGELAYPTLEQQMLEEGLLTAEHIENRKLLRRVMRHGGFWGIQTEWWHFNACTRDEAREKYAIIE